MAKRPTEASWDSDDDLLAEDSVSAFPTEREDDVDEDALLGNSDDEADGGAGHGQENYVQVNSDVAAAMLSDINDNDYFEIELAPDDFIDEVEKLPEEVHQSNYPVATTESYVHHDESYASVVSQADTTAESIGDAIQEEVMAETNDSDSESDEDEDHSHRDRFHSERTSQVANLTSSKSSTQIPDTLEISQEDQQKIEAFMKPGQKRKNSKQQNVRPAFQSRQPHPQNRHANLKQNRPMRGMRPPLRGGNNHMQPRNMPWRQNVRIPQRPLMQLPRNAAMASSAHCISIRHPSSLVPGRPNIRQPLLRSASFGSIIRPPLQQQQTPQRMPFQQQSRPILQQQRQFSPPYRQQQPQIRPQLAPQPSPLFPQPPSRIHTPSLLSSHTQQPPPAVSASKKMFINPHFQGNNATAVSRAWGNSQLDNQNVSHQTSSYQPLTSLLRTASDKVFSSNTSNNWMRNDEALHRQQPRQDISPMQILRQDDHTFRTPTTYQQPIQSGNPPLLSNPQSVSTIATLPGEPLVHHGGSNAHSSTHYTKDCDYRGQGRMSDEHPSNLVAPYQQNQRQNQQQNQNFTYNQQQPQPSYNQHYDHESAGQPIATRVTRHPDPVLPVPVKKPSIKERLDQPAPAVPVPQAPHVFVNHQKRLEIEQNRKMTDRAKRFSSTQSVAGKISLGKRTAGTGPDVDITPPKQARTFSSKISASQKIVAKAKKSAQMVNIRTVNKKPVVVANRTPAPVVSSSPPIITDTTLDVDEEYLRKLEEQKKKRERILQIKEARRKQNAGTKSTDATTTSSTAPEEQVQQISSTQQSRIVAPPVQQFQRGQTQTPNRVIRPQGHPRTVNTRGNIRGATPRGNIRGGAPRGQIRGATPQPGQIRGPRGMGGNLRGQRGHPRGQGPYNQPIRGHAPSGPRRQMSHQPDTDFTNAHPMRQVSDPGVRPTGTKVVITKKQMVEMLKRKDQVLMIKSVGTKPGAQRMQNPASQLVMQGGRGKVPHSAVPINPKREVLVGAPSNSRTVVMPSNGGSKTVSMDGIAASTSETKIKHMAEQFGQLESFRMVRKQNKVVMTFANAAHASAFSQRHNRRMLDLAMVSVQLVN